jgi:hypothetical protein
LAAARAVIDPGQHRGETEKDAANGNRQKKRICWHVDLPDVTDTASAEMPEQQLICIKI